MALRVCAAFHLMAWNKALDIELSALTSSLLLIIIYFRHSKADDNTKLGKFGVLIRSHHPYNTLHPLLLQSVSSFADNSFNSLLSRK